MTNIKSCYKCGSNKSMDGKWNHWYRDKDVPGMWLCRGCRAKRQYIEQIDRFSDRNKIRNPMRQYSKGKRVLLKENPRIGVCGLCRSVAGTDCEFTTSHNGIEMCPTCKGKTDHVDKILKSISGWHKGRKHSTQHCEAMSKTLKGRVSPMKGKNRTEEQKEKMSVFRMTQNFPRTDTKPEKIIKSLLINTSIVFQTQIPFVIKGMVRRHKVDFLINPNIIIECDGIYWHTKPKQLARDKSIDEELTRQGYNILRLTDYEILTDTNSCMNKINEVLARIKY